MTFTEFSFDVVPTTSECQQLGLCATPVENDESLEWLRILRNETAWGFSHDTSGRITTNQQHEWWTRMRGRVKAWLYVERDRWSFVGFGVLRQTDDGRWWTSVGVGDRWRERGYGGAIMADLIRRHHGTVYSTARKDNIAGQRLHRHADWAVIEQDDERLIGYVTRGRLT